MATRLTETQFDKALALLRRGGITRMSEFRRAGITAATITRLERAGKLSRLARGLYQLPNAKVGTHHTLAEASKLVPKRIVCLGSALAFHGLTDQVPARVRIAIGRKDWRPKLMYAPMRFARFLTSHLRSGVERHAVEGGSVPIFSVCKTVADVFRYRRTVGINLAIEGMREALQQRKVTPAELARCAGETACGKSWNPTCALLRMAKTSRDIGASVRAVGRTAIASDTWPSLKPSQPQTAVQRFCPDRAYDATMLASGTLLHQTSAFDLDRGRRTPSPSRTPRGNMSLLSDQVHERPALAR
jgi:Transcriptional regulator, AbiEi antitoxin